MLFACGGKKNGGDDDGDGGNNMPDACVGLECQVVDCAAMGQPPTAITGKVFAPNGTLPLNGVNVYVARDLPLPPFVEGATCDRCASTLPGGPIAQTVSGEDGSFRLEGVPAGDGVNLVITTGKWRRVAMLPNVAQCQDNSAGAADTRLPRTRQEGEIPKIAITVGDADSLECLIRKVGIADSEINVAGNDARIHLYRGDGVSKIKGGPNLPAAGGVWSTANNLKTYDIMFLSCEGSQMADGNGGTNKSQADLNAMKEYADLGGRVFASHWNNIWVGGNFQGNPGLAPPVWKDVATWTAQDGDPGSPILIDETQVPNGPLVNPKGTAFANWMLAVGGSRPNMRGKIDLQSGTERRTALTLAMTTDSTTPKAERWVRSNADNPQMFQFTTPNEAPLDQRCGKVVFTDMHVTGTSNVGMDYPDSCPDGANALDMTPQEKALAFMFFDIASCVGGIF